MGTGTGAKTPGESGLRPERAEISDGWREPVDGRSPFRRAIPARHLRNYEAIPQSTTIQTPSTRGLSRERVLASERGRDVIFDPAGAAR